MDFRPVSRQTTNPLRSSATPVKTMNPSSTIFYFTIFFLLRLLSIFNSYSIFMSFYICFNTWEIRNWILYILNFFATCPSFAYVSTTIVILSCALHSGNSKLDRVHTKLCLVARACVYYYCDYQIFMLHHSQQFDTGYVIS